MGRGYSVSIGLSPRDATAYADLFGGIGYEPALFVGGAASRWAVLARLHEISRTASVGDVVAVTFSGAGGRCWSDAGVETFWHCCDGRLTHTDLQRAWSWFDAGVRILIIDDCCYSIFSEWDRARKTSDVVRYGATQQDVGDAALISMPGAAASCTTDTAATVLCLTACSCPGTESDRCPGGLFTEALLRTWNRGGFRGSYGTFCKRIRQALCGLQTPELVAVGPHVREFEMQRPFTIALPTTEALSWLAKPNPGSSSSRSSCTTATKTARSRSSGSA